MVAALPSLDTCEPVPARGIVPERTHYRAWAGGVIAALFIALASALLPGALPSSQAVGSAFNPATTLVALSRNEAERACSIAAPEDGERRNLGFGCSGEPVAADFADESGFAPHPRAAIAVFARPSARTLAFAPRPGSGPRAPPA